MVAKCKDCQYFDSPEWPPEREMGSCTHDGCEPMPPYGDPCDEFMQTSSAMFREAREGIEEEWDRRGGWRE